MGLSRRGFVSVAAAAVLSAPGWSASAWAATDPQGAAQFIRWLGDQALALLRNPSVSLEQREASFRSLLREGFDLDFIGRFTLGRHAGSLTPEQKIEFREAFAEFVLKTYARRLSAYSGETFTVGGAQPAGEQDAVVSTRLERNGAPLLGADWRVRVIDNRFRVIDVAVQGISMSVTQRQEFASVISSSGIRGLIAQLRARADKAPASQAMR